MSQSSNTKLDPRCFASQFMKRITLFLFYILPSKITNIFVSLSIISMIMEIRQDKIQSDETLIAKISEVLKVHLSESVLLLPEQTLNWYWKPELFDTYVVVGNQSKTLREIILSKEDFMKYKGTVLNAMLDSLPPIMKRKLRLSEPAARLVIKHNIVNTFIHG